MAATEAKLPFQGVRLRPGARKKKQTWLSVSLTHDEAPC